ncbi:DUF4259 domain-containing protein [Sebaldella sp. S0638]|uniref:DUF4259 domain-containing protein n=1 Tax=Sebaldella sp. S0638 TaxID=2957809 RepID=UPI00209EE0C4|nr:DUF4259 domain-containing protein [Sebaldella sp. S0638]MCP1223458.1 DUF4259 domain-containing protein [Sebaldella sp. S0638]
MGAWGVRALDSDEGLDVLDEFTDYSIENDKIKIGDLIEYFIEAELLPENPDEKDFLYDQTVMVLAELLEEYNEKGKIILEYEDDDEEEVEAEIADVSFDESDINYLTEQITDILEPKGEIHETYELWEDSESFQEWKEHVLSLLETLKSIKENL